ncbi:MAG: DUF192 domain-containing protein [Myxococcales bacterium]
MPALTCPGCKAEMTESTSSDIAVDVCPSCSGLWLDAGEFEKLGGELPKGGVPYGGERRCPRCDMPMDLRPSKVAELDICPRCHGMYLDKTELNLLVKVAQIATEDLARVQPPTPRKKGAAPTDGRFAKITNQPTEPRFICGECKRPRPMSEQVIGARTTICTDCAGLKHIAADPVARRKAELSKLKPSAPAPGKPAPNPARATPADDDIVSDLLFGRRRPASFRLRRRRQRPRGPHQPPAQVNALVPRLALLPFLLLLASCNETRQASPDRASSTPSPAVTEPEPPMLSQRGKVEIKTRDGKEYLLDVEIASDDPSRARGLMFRRTMPEMAGMIFVFPEVAEHRFWMKNTLLSLDMLFIAADGTVIGIVERAEPQTTTGRAVEGDSKYVLEVNGGWCQKHGVAAGDRIRLMGMYDLK